MLKGIAAPPEASSLSGRRFLLESFVRLTQFDSLLQVFFPNCPRQTSASDVETFCLRELPTGHVSLFHVPGHCERAFVLNAAKHAKHGKHVAEIVPKLFAHLITGNLELTLCPAVVGAT